MQGLHQAFYSIGLQLPFQHRSSHLYHWMNAEYTREIAERIASVTGARVADILKCIPHISLYEQKETGVLSHYREKTKG